MSDESQGIDPYDAVLADLRTKRDHIDMVISLIEELRQSTAASLARVALAATRQEAPSGGIDGPGALLGLSITEAAKKILATKRVPLRNPELVLTRRFEEIGDVVRVGRGTWGLKEWYPGRSFKKEKPDNGDKGELPPEGFTNPTIGP
jgi:hypothetical protein